jgi:hypothetical protein
VADRLTTIEGDGGLAQPFRITQKPRLPHPLRFSKGGLSNDILGFGRLPGGGAEILHQSFAGGFSGALLEKVGRGFCGGDFFGDGWRDPMGVGRIPLGGLLVHAGWGSFDCEGHSLCE